MSPARENAHSEATDRARLHMIVTGRVQGVFYRASAAEQARALGIIGWARNLPNGSVEIIAEGRRADLQKFTAWARSGPPSARVAEVREEWGQARSEFSDFRVY